MIQLLSIRVISNTGKLIQLKLMKAIILVGGYGTRMRPLTFHCPKPIFPFISKTPVEYMVEALAKIGVKEIILGINCQTNSKISAEEFHHHSNIGGKVIPINAQAAEIIKTLSPLQSKYGVKFIYSQKHEALGTAGPIKYAEKELKEGNTEGVFFVFNSDVICNYPLQELLDFHRKHGKEGSILLATVEDPSRFGVVIRDEATGQVQRFKEKPKEFVGNHINAGIYVLNTSILDRMPQRFCMIQTEIYPKMAEEGQLYSLPIKDNFWFDIGKPADYLKAQGAFLNYYKINTRPNESSGNVFVHETAKVGQDCKIGPNVSIGPFCKIGKGVRLTNCSIIADTTVGDFTFISDTIISWGCTIGSNVRIEGLTAIAQDCEVKDEVRISECMICSHKNVGGNVQKEILM